MIIGIYWGYVAMIEGLTKRIKAEVARPLTVVATAVSQRCSTSIPGLSTRLSPTLRSRGWAFSTT